MLEYSDGTTDVTRSVHFGTPTARQKVTNIRLIVFPSFILEKRIHDKIIVISQLRVSAAHLNYASSVGINFKSEIQSHG